LAEDVVAEFAQPPFPRSPLDGYAVRGEDTKGSDADHPVELKLIGKIYAGQAFSGTVGPGEALRLMTGSPIPEGANAVIRQEDTDYEKGQEQKNTVKLFQSVAPFQNYCYAGEDFKKGEKLISRGTLLRASHTAILSTLGRVTVPVYKKAQVSVISTGDEVIAPGEKLLPGKIYDSNENYIVTRLEELKNPAIFHTHAGDDAFLLCKLIREARKRGDDMVITTGGVSVGEKDIMHEVRENLEGQLIFQGVKMKPGMPTFAFSYQGMLVMALSGNPFGAVAHFELVVREALYKMTKNPLFRVKTEHVLLGSTTKKPAGTRRFLRGRVEDGKAYISDRSQSSGSFSAMAECDCFIEIPVEMDGETVGKEVLVHWI
jgi:molybdopterin molybdotransferase